MTSKIFCLLLPFVLSNCQASHKTEEQSPKSETPTPESKTPVDVPDTKKDKVPEERKQQRDEAPPIPDTGANQKENQNELPDKKEERKQTPPKGQSQEPPKVDVPKVNFKRVYDAPTTTQDVVALRDFFKKEYKEERAKIKTKDLWDPPKFEKKNKDLFKSVKILAKDLFSRHADLKREFLTLRLKGAVSPEKMAESIAFKIPPFGNVNFDRDLKARILEYNFLRNKSHDFAEARKNVLLSEEIRTFEMTGGRPFAMLARIQNAIVDVEPILNFQKMNVSGNENRCWLRSAWRPILEEALRNPTFYQRLVAKIEESGRIYPIADKANAWAKTVRKMKTWSPETLESFFNSMQYDDQVSDYGRALSANLTTDHSVEASHSQGSMWHSKSFFEYFNIDILYVSEKSFPRHILTQTDNETIFTNRYVLYGVPDHWNLLKNPNH